MAETIASIGLIVALLLPFAVAMKLTEIRESQIRRRFDRRHELERREQRDAARMFRETLIKREKDREAEHRANQTVTIKGIFAERR